MQFLKRSSFYILLILGGLSSLIGLWVWLPYILLLTVVCMVIISTIKKKYNIDYEEAFNRGFLFTIPILLITLPPYFITIAKVKESNVFRYTKVEETKTVKVRHSKHKYVTDNTTCTNCNIGKYHNGICSICGTASDELTKEHTDEYDKVLREINQYTCPYCEGNGCKKCKFKGIITPY